MSLLLLLSMYKKITVPAKMSAKLYFFFNFHSATEFRGRHCSSECIDYVRYTIFSDGKWVGCMYKCIDMIFYV